LPSFPELKVTLGILLGGGDNTGPYLTSPGSILVGVMPSVTVVRPRLFAIPGNAPEEVKLQRLQTPNSVKTKTPAFSRSNAFRGLEPAGVEAGWIPTAPVTLVEGAAAVRGLEPASVEAGWIPTAPVTPVEGAAAVQGA
jgi:hypothetical protein